MVNMHLGFGRQRLAAVVEVFPGGASVSIITLGKDAPSEIVSSGHAVIVLEPRTDEQARARIASQVTEAAAQAIQQHKGPLGHIAEVYVFLHGPWSETQMLTGEHVHDHDQKIHSSHIGQLVKESMTSAKAVDLKNLLEGSVIAVYLNGYPTSEPEGKMAKRLRTISLASICDRGLRDSIEGAVHASFPSAEINWRTSLRAYAKIAQNTLNKDSYLVVDMGIDNTHIASIHDGILSQVIINEGARTLLTRLAPSRPTDDTLSLVRMLARDACSSEACESIKTAMAVAEPELVRIFGEAMAKIATVHKIPNDVLLSANSDLEPWLSSFLSRIDFAQFTLTSLPLTVHTQKTLDITRWLIGTDSANSLSCALVNMEERE